MTDIDAATFRDTMGQFCTGVVIVTGVDSGELAGFAAQSFVSLSQEPPLVSISPQKTSTSWPKIRKTGRFGINVLADDQGDVSNAFARKGEVADIGWQASGAGSAVLDGVLAYIDCMVEAEHDAGDHTIVIGRVVHLETLRQDSRPLLFFRGGYGQFAALDFGQDTDGAQQVLIHRVVVVHVELHVSDDLAEIRDKTAEDSGFIHAPQDDFWIAF